MRDSITIDLDDRAVIWTVQAFLALLVLMSVLAIAVETVTTSSDSQGAQFRQTQLQQTASDLTSILAGTNNTTNAVLYWDVNASRWYNAENNGPNGTYYVTLDGTGHPLESVVEDSIATEAVAYNVWISYNELNGSDLVAREQRLVYQGPPGRDAVTSEATVVLNDDDQLSMPNRDWPCSLREMYTSPEQGGCNGGSEQSYFAPDVFGSVDTPGYGGNRYNTVKIEVTVWRL